MDIRRAILFAALGLVIYSLWNHWQVDYPFSPPAIQEQRLAKEEPSSPLLPSMNPTAQKQLIHSPEQHNSNRFIHVQTDVLNVDIDLSEGNIVYADLRQYAASNDHKDQPFVLLNHSSDGRYVANSGLVQVQHDETLPLNVEFTAAQPRYELSPQQNELNVTLEGKTADGLLVTKQYKFRRGQYLIDVDYDLKNQGTDAWQGYVNTQLVRQAPSEDKSSLFHLGSFTGASYSAPGQHRYQKISFKDMQKNNLDQDVTGGWVAMQQHYFLTAWVPVTDAKSRLYTRTLSHDDTYTIGAVSSSIHLAPSQDKSYSTRLYLGPEIASDLKAIAPGLDLTVDYGWLWFISSLLFSLMKSIHTMIGNWGWAIVLVTVLIKLTFYRLSATSYKSMANMRKLQPKLTSLRERHGDDKAKLSQATMALYREEKVNPLGGCLPIVIQIPVFIALYWVLAESVELRQAPFVLWIHDLSIPDPFHVLPIFMGLTMLIQQKLNPAPPDPMQAKVMMFLPVFFTALFWNFPAGLVLYWSVNNGLSILQQWYITRKYSQDDQSPPRKLVPVK